MANGATNWATAPPPPLGTPTNLSNGERGVRKVYWGAAGQTGNVRPEQYWCAGRQIRGGRLAMKEPVYRAQSQELSFNFRSAGHRALPDGGNDGDVKKMKPHPTDGTNIAVRGIQLQRCTGGQMMTRWLRAMQESFRRDLCAGEHKLPQTRALFRELERWRCCARHGR